MTKGDRWKVPQGWRSPGWAQKPSSAEPDTGEPDAIKVARPVREGAVGNLRKPVAPVVRRCESQQGAGRLLHRRALRLARAVRTTEARRGSFALIVVAWENSGSDPEKSVIPAGRSE